jgi:hypothetical protein
MYHVIVQYKLTRFYINFFFKHVAWTTEMHGDLENIAVIALFTIMDHHI